MDTTNFNLNDRVYRRIRNGSPVDFVHVRINEDFPEVVYITDTHRSFVTFAPTIEGTPEHFTITMHEVDFTLELKELTLADVQEFYTGSVRTFDDVTKGEQYIRRDILTNNYAEQFDAPFSGLTVTFSDDGKALELTREDEEGNLFYRESSDWVEVTDSDMPTIFDRRYISIQPEDSDAIVSLWDEARSDETDLHEEDITPFAAFIQ